MNGMKEGVDLLVGIPNDDDPFSAMLQGVQHDGAVVLAFVQQDQVKPMGRLW